jgi:hypothetical protein
MPLALLQRLSLRRRWPLQALRPQLICLSRTAPPGSPYAVPGPNGFHVLHPIYHSLRLLHPARASLPLAALLTASPRPHLLLLVTGTYCSISGLSSISGLLPLLISVPLVTSLYLPVTL